MPGKERYIIIICDDEELCKQLHNSFQAHPVIARTAIVNTLDQLKELAEEKMPDTILLYLVQAYCTPAQWIRSIRQDTKMDAVRILVYSGAPDAPDLRDLLA